MSSHPKPPPTDLLSTSVSPGDGRLANGLPRPELPTSGSERLSSLWRQTVGRVREAAGSQSRVAENPVAIVALAAVLSAALVVTGPQLWGWIGGSEHNLVDGALPVLERTDLIGESAATGAPEEASSDADATEPQSPSGTAAPATPSGELSISQAGDVVPGTDLVPAEAVPTSGPVFVHVAGAVDDPGVVELAAGARVIDAITSAGGPADGADLDRLNLAQPLGDGQRIFVPAHDDLDEPDVLAVTPVLETAPQNDFGGGGPLRGTDAAPRLVGVNSASRSELETLPGIGPTMAAAIVSFREENGPFVTVDQLLDVSGIGPARLEALRPLVFVS